MQEGSASDGLSGERECLRQWSRGDTDSTRTWSRRPIAAVIRRRRKLARNLWAVSWEKGWCFPVASGRRLSRSLVCAALHQAKAQLPEILGPRSSDGATGRWMRLRVLPCPSALSCIQHSGTPDDCMRNALSSISAEAQGQNFGGGNYTLTAPKGSLGPKRPQAIRTQAPQLGQTRTCRRAAWRSCAGVESSGAQKGGQVLTGKTGVEVVGWRIGWRIGWSQKADEVSRSSWLCCLRVSMDQMARCTLPRLGCQCLPSVNWTHQAGGGEEARPAAAADSRGSDPTAR